MTDDTSSFMPQKGGTKFAMTDDTSSFMPQKGGSSNKTSNDQVEQLISMLTSETEDKHNTASNSTSTSELEIKLRNVLQKGGRFSELELLQRTQQEADKLVKKIAADITNTKRTPSYRASITVDEKQKYDNNIHLLEEKLSNATNAYNDATARLTNYTNVVKRDSNNFNKAVGDVGLFGMLDAAYKTLFDTSTKSHQPAPNSRQTTETIGTTTTFINTPQLNPK